MPESPKTTQIISLWHSTTRTSQALTDNGVVAAGGSGGGDGDGDVAGVEVEALGERVLWRCRGQK